MAGFAFLRGGAPGGDEARRVSLACLRDVSGAWFGIVGLAFCLCSLEVYRYPVVQLVGEGSSGINMTVSTAVLLVLALTCRLGRVGVLRRPALMMGNGLVGSVLLFVAFTMGKHVGPSSTAFLVLLALFIVSSSLLLVSWSAMLYRMDACEASLLFVAAIGASGCLQGASAMLSSEVVQGTCALFPLLAALFYLLFERSRAQALPFAPTDGDVSGDGETAFSGRSHRAGYIIAAVLFLCYGLFFSRMHLTWLPAQEAWGATAIQVASASGALVAFVVLTVVRPLPNRRMSVVACESLMIACAFFSIFLTGSAIPGLEPLYLCPMNAAQKTLIYFAFYISLPLRSPAARTACFCLLLAAYRVASPLYAGVAAASGLLGLGDGLVETTYVLAMALAVLVLVAVMANPSLLPCSSDLADQRGSDGSDSKERGLADDVARYRSIAFYVLLGQKYSLTQREVEIVPLLFERRGAREISDALSISQATAKTHIRNIYQKMGVHTQDDLVFLMAAEQTALFEHLPDWCPSAG